MADLQLNGTTLFTESGGTVSFGSATPQGMIINVTVHRDFTRGGYSSTGGSTHTNWACGNFTKQLSTSMIHANFHMPFVDDSSGVCGTGLRIDDDTSLWRYGINYNYHNLIQNPNASGDWSMQAIHGQCLWARGVVSAGVHAMNFGWYPANGSTNESPWGRAKNPNSSDGARNPQHGSSIVIMEIA